MRVSARGRAFIEREEGLRLVAYDDGEGNQTIGYGHTGPEVVPGLVWDQKRCDEALETDLGCVEHVIAQHCRPADMLQNEFDAMASLCFNIGGKHFADSTVVRDYNRGDFQGAADAFLMWRKPPRLIPRRERERELFLTPYVQNTEDV
jgi:lysozyme